MGELTLSEQTVIDTPSTGLRTLSPKPDGWYEKDDQGNETTLKGEKGDTGDAGPQGAQGLQGPTGADGPEGPVAVLYNEDDYTQLTLPNTNSYQNVYSRDIDFLTTSHYILQANIAVRPHSASNDMVFFWDLDEVTTGPIYTEEHKDTNSAQANLRQFQIDLGTVTAGIKPLDLYFRKEATGGTAQLKFVSIIIWKVD